MVTHSFRRALWSPCRGFWTGECCSMTVSSPPKVRERRTNRLLIPGEETPPSHNSKRSTRPPPRDIHVHVRSIPGQNESTISSTPSRSSWVNRGDKSRTMHGPRDVEDRYGFHASKTLVRLGCISSKPCVREFRGRAGSNISIAMSPGSNPANEAMSSLAVPSPATTSERRCQPWSTLA